MCGKEGNFLLADIEGVELKVCPTCAKFGTVKSRRTSLQQEHFSKEVREEPEFSIIADYALLLKSAREKKGLSQEDFAKLIREKESALAKWEAGKLKPSVETAWKLERLLEIKLVEGPAGNKTEAERKAIKNTEMTIGDFIKVRKRSIPG